MLGCSGTAKDNFGRRGWPRHGPEHGIGAIEISIRGARGLSYNIHGVVYGIRTKPKPANLMLIERLAVSCLVHPGPGTSTNPASRSMRQHPASDSEGMTPRDIIYCYVYITQ